MKEVSPLVFGPGTWIIMHIFALVCDSSDNGETDRECFLKFVKKILERLPCKTCRKHSSEYYNQNPPENEQELFKWTWKFHNSVNKRLGKDVIEYEDAKNLYENAEVILSENGEECEKCDESWKDGNKEINITVS